MRNKNNPPITQLYNGSKLELLAKEVLTANPEMSTLMPCAWGVYQKDGKVFITGMNTRLMGKLFGGTIARVMGGSVAQDEAAILKQVIRP